MIYHYPRTYTCKPHQVGTPVAVVALSCPELPITRPKTLQWLFSIAAGQLLVGQLTSTRQPKALSGFEKQSSVAKHLPNAFGLPPYHGQGLALLKHESGIPTDSLSCFIHPKCMDAITLYTPLDISWVDLFHRLRDMYLERQSPQYRGACTRITIGLHHNTTNNL